MDSQTDVAVVIRAECKACISINGGITHRDGNRNEVALLPRKHFFQFSTLLQSLTGKTEIVELLPVHLFRIDGGGILLFGQIILKGNTHLCQLLFAFWLLSVL